MNSFSANESNSAVRYLSGHISMSGTGKDPGKFTLDDPFMLDSNSGIPVDIESALDLGLYLFYLSAPFQAVVHRVVGHFITDLAVEGDVSSEAKSKMRDMLYNNIHAKSALLHMGIDLLGPYGNSFFYIYEPFDRLLIDKRGDKPRFYSLNNVKLKRYNAQNMTYEIVDPQRTGRTTHLPFVDYPSNDVSRSSIEFLDPRRVTMRKARFGPHTEYIYRIEEWLKTDVMEGKAFWHINNLPRKMLEVIRDNHDYRFGPGKVFSAHLPSPSGLSNSGWGIPNPIAMYRVIHQLQVYAKIDEALAKDYMVPFRVVSPNLSGPNAQEIIKLVGVNWKREMSNLIDRHRKRLTDIGAFPFPIHMEEMNAAGKQLTPKDLKEFEITNLFNSMNFPAELHTGNMQFQMIPSAVRLFESSYSYFMDMLSDAAQFIADGVSRIAEFTKVKATVRAPTMAEDAERQAMLMEMGAAGEISRERAFRGLNIEDPVEERLRRVDEDMRIQKEEAAKMEEAERELMAGSLGDILAMQMQQEEEAQGGGGGAPMPGGGGGTPVGGPIQPSTIKAQAEDIVSQMIKMPGTERRRMLDQLRNTNPEMHAMVKELMEQYKRQNESQARAESVAP